MIRLMIDWDMVSPFLQTISGTLKLEDIDTTYKKQPITLIKCIVKRKPGSTGYTSIDDKGIPSDLFEEIKPFVDIMIHSYYKGVVMEKDDFHWVDEKYIDPLILKKWKEKIKKGEVYIE